MPRTISSHRVLGDGTSLVAAARPLLTVGLTLVEAPTTTSVKSPSPPSWVQHSASAVGAVNHARTPGGEHALGRPRRAVAARALPCDAPQHLVAVVAAPRVVVGSTGGTSAAPVHPWAGEYDVVKQSAVAVYIHE